MSELRNYIGYMKYSGKLVENGLLDIHKSAEALLGFEKALKFFMYKQAPSLRNSEFEFPVKINEGSWEVLIPDTVSTWVQAGLGVVATAYATKAVQKMAERDFNEFGITDIIKKSLIAIQWVIKIGKHLGNITYKHFDDAKFQSETQEIGIKNSEGEFLYVPKEYLELYISANPKILEGIIKIVDIDRDLNIGVIYEDQEIVEVITKKDKNIFIEDEDELSDIELFPEFEHNQEVVLEGEITKGNKSTNTLGFRYEGHILIAKPRSGSVISYKPAIFRTARIYGRIERITSDFERLTKPKIIFERIETLEDDTKGQTDLFGN